MKAYTNYTQPTPRLHLVKPRILATILLFGVISAGSGNFLDSEKTLNLVSDIGTKYKVYFRKRDFRKNYTSYTKNAETTQNRRKVWCSFDVGKV